jgi:glutamyl-tRNA synthetase
MSVTAYRDMGFLPEALVNYLVRLGWSHGDQEFFTRDELIKVFDLKNIGRSAGIFDPDKLLALNAEHIKATSPPQLVAPLTPFLNDCGIQFNDDDYICNVIETLAPRSKTLAEMAQAASFFYLEEITFEEKAARKFLKPATLKPLSLLMKKLADLPSYTQENLEDVFKDVMAQTGLKLGKIAQPVRVALTGKTASPGIFEIITILGPGRVIPRLEKAIRYIEEEPVAAGGNESQK